MDVARLKSIPLFANVSDDELQTIAPFAQETDVASGQVLAKEGQYAYEFMAIEEGQAEVTREGEHVADLGPGDFFGEIGLLETQLRTATVTAKTPMRLLTLTGWDMKRLEKNIPQAVEEIRRVLDQRRTPESG
jgi:CRP/FNR family transcriptional regulator, cyclic AMP receptor protein